MIELTEYRTEYLTQMMQLFCDTVHTVNAKDYTPEQQDAWAPYSVIQDEAARRRWDNSLKSHLSLVAWDDGNMAGFADMDLEQGYLDRMYVSRDFQRSGVASILADRLELAAREAGCTRFTSDVSITAVPFFKGRGYRVLTKQEVERKGVVMVNFKMEKML